MVRSSLVLLLLAVATASSQLSSTGGGITSLLAAIKTAALQGGVGTFKQAMDVGGSLASSVPVFGPAVALGSNVLKSGADIVQNIGQSAINGSQQIGAAKMNALDRLVQLGATSVQSINAVVQSSPITTPTSITASPTSYSYNPNADIFY